jgi:hypothetical protein
MKRMPVRTLITASKPLALRLFSALCADEKRTLRFRIKVVSDYCYILECVELSIFVVQRAFVAVIESEIPVHIVDVHKERSDFTAHAIYTVLADRIMRKQRTCVFIEPRQLHSERTFAKMKAQFSMCTEYAQFILK